MRLSGTLRHTSASRPLATTENSPAVLASTRKCKSNASAAASKAGPRFAEVAGSISSSRSECFDGLFFGIRGSGGLCFGGLESLQHRIDAGVEDDWRTLLSLQSHRFLLEPRSREQIAAMKL